MRSVRGATMAQKIIARAAGRVRVEPGEYVDCTPDHLVNQELMWPVHKRNLDKLGITQFVRPERYIMVVDHTTSAAMGSAHPATHRIVKDVAQAYGVDNFFGPGNGLRHLLMVEKGFARPGGLIFSDEGNIASVGVVGALSIPMTTDIVAVLAKGQNWMSVPRTIRIELRGRLRLGVSARDLAQTLIKDHTASGDFTDSCLEFGGEGLRTLSLDERQTLLACVYHTGADTGLMEVDEVALDFVMARADGRPFTVMHSDADADFAMVLAYDLSRIEPMVTVPPTIDGAVPLSTVQGLRIDQATLGSCANNRLDDLRAAASVLRGRQIARHVTMYISPGSATVFADAAREGLLEVFSEAGATVLPPGCNTCWGYQGVLTGDEVSISTHQFNYQGRNGSRDAKVYLASPSTVAASAVAGCIASASDYLSGMQAYEANELDGVGKGMVAAACKVVSRQYVGQVAMADDAIASRAVMPSATTLRGRVWKFGDDVSGDNGIIDFSAVRDGFGKPFDEPLLKAMCFVRLNPNFPSQVRKGDIVVGGRNFANQNHVEVSAAIKLSGIEVVIVESCESAFVRRALSQGLPVMVVPGIAKAASQDDIIEADPATGVVRLADGRALHARPFSERMVAIWQAGGLIASLAREAPSESVAA